MYFTQIDDHTWVSYRPARDAPDEANLLEVWERITPAQVDDYGSSTRAEGHWLGQIGTRNDEDQLEGLTRAWLAIRELPGVRADALRGRVLAAPDAYGPAFLLSLGSEDPPLELLEPCAGLEGLDYREIERRVAAAMSGAKLRIRGDQDS